MFGSPYLSVALSYLLSNLPSLAVYVVGLALSASRLGKRPKAAKAGLVAFSGSIVVTLAGCAWNVFSVFAYSELRSFRAWGMVMGVVNVALSVLGAAFLGLLVYGMFAEEKRP